MGGDDTYRWKHLKPFVPVKAEIPVPILHGTDTTVFGTCENYDINNQRDGIT